MLTGNSLLKFNVLLEVGNLQIQKFGSGRILHMIRIYTGSSDVGSGLIRICTRSTKSTGYPAGSGSGAPLLIFREKSPIRFDFDLNFPTGGRLL